MALHGVLYSIHVGAGLKTFFAIIYERPVASAMHWLSLLASLTCFSNHSDTVAVKSHRHAHYNIEIQLGNLQHIISGLLKSFPAPRDILIVYSLADRCVKLATQICPVGCYH